MKDKELIRRYRIEDCAKCGNECADSCHVFRCYGKFHPQELGKLFIEKGTGGVAGHRLLWGCVTCRACTAACPYDVEFADFIRELRTGRSGYVPVGEGLVHNVQRMQAGRGTPSGKPVKRGAARTPGRRAWIGGSLDVGGTKEIALFTGCLPLFAGIFDGSCAYDPLEAARDAVRVLNALGVSPVLLEDERCCGRDMFDLGERETFMRLAAHNARAIGAADVKTVLTICPECAYTLDVTYRSHLGDMPLFDTKHMTEYIADNIERLDMTVSDERYAFHDPCYLGRYRGVFEAPRKILRALTSGKPVELPRSGESAPCCGAGSWMNHGPHTRQAAGDRLVEAHEAGAGHLVTACPKCAILFGEVNPDCSWRRSPVETVDLVSLVASRMKEKKE